MSKLENYFDQYRKNIIGIDVIIKNPLKKIVLVFPDGLA